MQTVRHIPRFSRTICNQAARISILSLALGLTACQKPQTETSAPKTPEKIELIQQDVVSFEQGTAIGKTGFTGTVRAVRQSSIQSQVTATATQVNVQAGQSVSQGQILVRLNNQDNAARLAQARATLSSAQAQEKLALNLKQRKKRLLDQGFISRLEYEQSDVDHQAQLENVRAQQAGVDIALKADQDGIIKSPISGVITQRQVEPGQTVSAGQTLFEIVDPNHIEIQAKLPADMQSSLNTGLKVEYTIQGNPQILSATVSRISPVADPNSRQIEFFATPDQNTGSQSIGAFVEGNILSAIQVNGQIIPLDTILNADKDPYVWVIRKQRIEQVKIRLLESRFSNNTAVVQGLEAGDLISRVKFSEQQRNMHVSISPKE